MTLVLDHSDFDVKGITLNLREGGTSSSYNHQNPLVHPGVEKQKDIQLKIWLGNINNVVLDTTKITAGQDVLVDGSYTTPLIRADASDPEVNACRGMSIAYDVSGGTIDPASVYITDKGWGGWMAGDVALIVGTDWTIEILSGDPSIGLIEDFNNANSYDDYYSNPFRNIYGVDRKPGDKGYTKNIVWGFSTTDQMYLSAWLGHDYDKLRSGSNGQKHWSSLLGVKTGVYDVRDYKAVGAGVKWCVTHCAEADNQFFFYAADNINNGNGQNQHEWGLVRVEQPAGGDYAPNTPQWVFLYWMPSTLQADYSGVYTQSSMRVMVHGDAVYPKPQDMEQIKSNRAGYMVKNTPYFNEGGLVGYAPSRLGFSTGYSLFDEMIDDNGDTWVKCGRAVWVKKDA